MRRVLLAALAACASPIPSQLTATLVSGEIRLARGEIEKMTFAVTLGGHHADRTALDLVSSELDDATTAAALVAPLQLTLGDQTWTSSQITLLDDGTDPVPLRSLCDKPLQLGVCIGASAPGPYPGDQLEETLPFDEVTCGPIGGVSIECVLW